MAHLNSLTALVTRTFTTSAPTPRRSTAIARSATMVAGALITMAGARVACAESNVAAWGRNDSGQCNIPPGLGVVTQIAAGFFHTIALKSDGTVACWGYNASGQCNPPAGLASVTQIAGGDEHTIALKSDGTVACWGWNDSGQCNPPAGLASVTQIAAGAEHTIALKSDGTVACWGWNGNGQCNSPAGLASVTQIAAGLNHTIALKSNGTVACWGSNYYDQCTIPPGLGVVTQIAGGYVHTIALKSDGTVACWGYNSYGACSPPAGLASVTQIAGGAYHTIALKSDGTVACWGYNKYGGCDTPAGLGPVTRVAAFGNHTVAMLPVAEECVTAATAVLGMNSINTSLLTPSANPPENGACVFLDWDNSKDAWFVYNAPSSGLLSADFCASSYDTSVVIYQGSCGALVRVGCADDECGYQNTRSRIIDLPVESGPVYIRIGGWQAEAGIATFELSFEVLQDPADDCVTAATAVLGMNSINTSLLTPSANPPEDGACVDLGWGNSKDAWFVYNAPSNGLLSADFCSSLYDTSVVIYQGSCGALARVGCDDDSCGKSYRSRIIDLPVQSGQVYIRIGGWEAEAGLATFDLSFELNCATDLDGNGSTGASDLAMLLSTWGNAGAADFDNNGNVGASDLAILLGAWGACP